METLNWREAPLVRACIPFCMGIALCEYSSYPIPFGDWLLLTLACLLILLALFRQSYRYRWLFGSLISIFLALGAYQWTWWRQDIHQITHFSKLTSEVTRLEGVIASEPDTGNTTKFVLKVQMAGGDTLRVCSGNLLVRIEKDSSVIPPKYGDVIVIRSKIQSIDPPQNPKAFDYRQYLHYQNIHFKAFVKKGDWQVRGHGKANPLMALAYRLRQSLVSTLQRYLKSDNEYAVGAALLLGYRTALNEDLQTAYQQTGSMHLLAVSGMHVGLIYAGLFFLFKYIRIRHPAWKTIQLLLLLLAVWGFTLLTGASASVMRAAAMFSFFIVGRSFKRFINAYNLMAASILCLLILDPYILFDPGGQLSYLAVAGILYFHPRLYRLWLPRRWIVDYAWQATSMGIAAQLMTLPISLYYFHQFPMYFWLAGLLAIPISTVAMYVGVILFAADAVSPLAGKIMGWIFYQNIHLMNGSIFLVQSLPWGLIEGIWIDLWDVLLLYSSIAMLVVALQTARLKYLIFVLLLLLGFIFKYHIGMIHHSGKHQVMVYYVRQNTLLDIMEGESAITLSGSGMKEQQEAFAAGSYRSFLQVKSIRRYHPDSCSIRTDRWQYRQGVLTFYDKKIVLLNQWPTEQQESRDTSDYVLVYDRPELKMDQLQFRYHPGMVIFDGSCPPWMTKKWKLQADSLGLCWHDLREGGAFMIP